MKWVFFCILCLAALGMADRPILGARGTQEETLSADQLRERQLRHEDFVIFDARDKQSYDESHIEGAVLPLPSSYYREQELFASQVINQPPDSDKALAEAMRRYPKNTNVVTYCNTDCHASTVLLLKIRQLGFENVQVMEDGFQSWEKKGYPVASSEGT